MRGRRWVLGVVVLLAGCLNNPRFAQLDRARELTPKQLGDTAGAADVAPPLPPQPRRVFTVRAWVDLDYQAQVLHWNERVVSQVQQASEVTKAALNVELQLVGVESWDHRGGRLPLEAQLLELERADHQGDVDLSLGFVSSLQVFSESQEKLGQARLPGRHAVVRATDNAEEHDAITRTFTRLDEGERAELYRARKQHKEVTLVLHEWAHALGAPHDDGGDSLVNAVYAMQRTRFPRVTLGLLARALELRDERADRRTRGRELAAFIRRAPPASWSHADLDATLQGLDRLASGEDAQTLATLSQRDRALYNEVVRLSDKGKREEALTALRPLLDRQPPLTGAESLGCQLSGMISLTGPETLARCAAASRASPEDGPALLMLAQAHAAAKDLQAARATYIAARQRLLAAPAVTGETQAALGAVARALGFVTWAELAAARAPGREAADRVVEWAARTRRWLGLPPDASSPGPEGEPAYLERFAQAQRELGGNQLSRAEATVGALEREFPALPGPVALRCELLLRRDLKGRATAACERAAAAYPESLQAHYLLGVLSSMSGQHRKVIDHLEAVVAGDETVDDAWRRLSVAYGALGDRKNRDRTARRQP